MLHIALYEPKIPSNTGNIIRLCANTGAQLHLIHPLGFELDDKKLRRAGLDYHEWANVLEHENYEAFLKVVSGQRIFACSSKGKHGYADAHFQNGDVLLMGSETSGLPAEVVTSLPSEQVIRIPMKTNSRSLNLSNATAVIFYEAWRQLGFN